MTDPLDKVVGGGSAQSLPLVFGRCALTSPPPIYINCHLTDASRRVQMVGGGPDHPSPYLSEGGGSGPTPPPPSRSSMPKGSLERGVVMVYLNFGVFLGDVYRSSSIVDKE